jgi:hypothetical protein
MAVKADSGREKGAESPSASSRLLRSLLRTQHFRRLFSLSARLNGREGERERVCVCVCVGVWVRVSTRGVRMEDAEEGGKVD